MGFPEFKCKAALSKTGGSSEAVIYVDLSHCCFQSGRNALWKHTTRARLIFAPTLVPVAGLTLSVGPGCQLAVREHGLT